MITGIIDHKGLKFNLDGKEIADKKFFQKSTFSYIPQNPTIFQSTIQNNITLFDENIDIEKYNKSLELSRADFVNSFEERDYKEVSENGSNMSGGQIQRIYIARAIYSDKNIIIFDDQLTNLTLLLKIKLLMIF